MDGPDTQQATEERLECLVGPMFHFPLEPQNFSLKSHANHVGINTTQFKKLDTRGVGHLDHDGLRRGLTRINHRTSPLLLFNRYVLY
jgi:hypothetical protein